MSLLQIWLLLSVLIAFGSCDVPHFQKTHGIWSVTAPFSRLISIMRFMGILLYRVAAIYLGITLLVVAAYSFSWSKSNDVGFLYYLSWLINEHNYKPYLQLFDTSFPGTFFIYSVLCGVFGYNDFGFHWADIFVLTILLVLTWRLLKPIHPRVALVAVITYGLYYLNNYGGMHLQRDYLAILPVVASLVVVQRCERSIKLSCFWIGFLFAISATIKPHFLVGLPVLAIGIIFMREKIKYNLYLEILITAISFMSLGFFVWLMIIIAWLLCKGGLVAFIDMASNYLPLYMKLDGSHQEIFWRTRWLPFFQETVGNVKKEWMFSCVALVWGLINITWERKKITLVFMLFSLLTLYILYVFLGGKGWDYHWMPFNYFAIICTSLLMIPNQKKINVLLWIIPATFCGILFSAYFFMFHKLYLKPNTVSQKIQELMVEYNKYPYHDKNTQDLIEYLKIRTQPGDQVELRLTGTTGPFFNALLEAQLLPVSKYPLQLIFYRNTDEPYVIKARGELLRELEMPPQFILDDNQFSSFSGADGSLNFPEYDNFLRNNYILVNDNIDRAIIPNQFLIYERKNN